MGAGATRSVARLGVKLAVVLLLVLAGVLAVLGSGLSFYLEAEGFGVPVETGPRAGYLLAYAVGALLGVLVPAVVAWRLLPGSGRWVAPVGGVLALVVGVALLGLVR